jgi:trehalose/maltose hydrolase-like predicted phosphorylase
LDFDESVPREPLEGSTLDLLSYPSLDLQMTPKIRRNDFDYTMIAVRQGHHEPHGMGMAPASIAAAAVGDTDLAVEWLKRNFTDNLIKPPFNVRTETATNNTGYFVTSSGGFLQNLLFGFAGLRIQEKGLSESYAPILPREWKSMTLKGVAFRGERFDIVVDRDPAGRVRLTRHPLPN